MSPVRIGEGGRGTSYGRAVSIAEWAASMSERRFGASAAGLSQSILAGLSPESIAQQSDTGTALRRRATLTLQSLTLPQLGAFIAEWRAREPGWAVSDGAFRAVERPTYRVSATLRSWPRPQTRIDWRQAESSSPRWIS
jgi:hypothetical protein